MIDINYSVYNIVQYYNNNPSLNVLAVYGKHIVSPTSDPDKNTVSVFPIKMDFTGTPGRFVVTTDDVPQTYVQYEPIVHMRTVFTGNAAYQNAALHYERMNENFKQFTDQSLLANTPFRDMSLMFDQTRYLIRMQSDSRYLCLLWIPVSDAYIETFNEDLTAYASPALDQILTTRIIQGAIDG